LSAGVEKEKNLPQKGISKTPEKGGNMPESGEVFCGRGGFKQPYLLPKKKRKT